MATPTWASARRVRLVLLFLLLGLVLGAGALPSWAAWQVTSPPSTLAAWPNTACVSRTERGVIFDLLGYQTQPDGTTLLAVRITNPQRLALDALGFTSAGWQRVAPAEGSTYPGRLGTYSVQWVLDLVLPKQAAFRLRPQGNWFQKGASETFVLTVRTFDAQQPLVAWARANLQLAVLRVRPADFPCLIVPPTPTPTLTPTLTPTPTPPFSPLPTPTPTPLGYALPAQPVLSTCVFNTPASDEPLIALDSYTFSEPQIILTNTAPIAINQWLPDNRTLLITRRRQGAYMPVSFDLLDTQTRALTPILGPQEYIVNPKWLAPDTIAYADMTFEPTPPNDKSGLWLYAMQTGQRRRLTSTVWPFIYATNTPGTELAFVGFPGGTQPYRWQQASQSLQVLPVDLAQWLYTGIGVSEPRFRRPGIFAPQWQPNGSKLLFYYGPWLFLYDLNTKGACQINPQLPRIGEQATIASDVKWSPNGRFLAMRITGEEGHGPWNQLLILDIHTGQIFTHHLPVSVFHFDWSPDNQVLGLMGDVEPEDFIALDSLHLLNVRSGELRRVFLAQTYVVTGVGIAWSPLGDRIVFQCDPSEPEVRIGDQICLSQVTHP